METIYCEGFQGVTQYFAPSVVSLSYESALELALNLMALDMVWAQSGSRRFMEF